MGFYDIFIKTFFKNPYKNEDVIDTRMSNPYFRKFCIHTLNHYRNHNQRKDFFELVEYILNSLKHKIRKPQQLLFDDDEYYVAIDCSTHTKYICYKSLCILDFDVGKSGFETKQDIYKYIKQHEILNTIPYFLTETQNGIHIYLLDKPRDYNDPETLWFITQFRCDFYYSLYCYLRGFSIRLSLKDNETYPIIKYSKFNSLKTKRRNQHLTELMYRQYSFLQTTF